MSYRLARLKVVYNARLRGELDMTIDNLKSTLGWLPTPLPMPERLPRRSWRVWYLKSPFREKIRKKHYVFHDWRYAFTFSDVEDPRPIMSSVLGAMSKETACTVDFAWHYPGDNPSREVSDQIEAGRSNYLAKNRYRQQQATTGWRSMFKHWNLKQYIPDEYR